MYERLGRLGAREDLRLAGLAHAVYGTDGFELQLVTTAHRPAMIAVLGAETESIVHRYGACDRRKTWPELATARQVWNRFDGSVESLGDDALRDFADLTIVNELDVVEASPAVRAEHGRALADRFESWAAIASPAVVADARAVLAGP